MNTKLTLSIDEEIISKAKKYAQQKKRSLSDLIEGYLKVITTNIKEEKEDVSPIIRGMRGSFTALKGIDNENLTKALKNKYKL